ncbi:MAG TPA: hypothetical protein VF701_09870 [Thermoanaerobaculia bacterium]
MKIRRESERDLSTVNGRSRLQRTIGRLSRQPQLRFGVLSKKTVYR